MQDESQGKSHIPDLTKKRSHPTYAIAITKIHKFYLPFKNHLNY
ncbi:hypothetical protein [Nostoc sp. FACHB-280]|nr:hypothetical protein [Nostoc sp. FACHB-280]